MVTRHPERHDTSRMNELTQHVLEPFPNGTVLMQDMMHLHTPDLTALASTLGLAPARLLELMRGAQGTYDEQERISQVLGRPTIL